MHPILMDSATPRIEGHGHEAQITQDETAAEAALADRDR
jgi:hypothetical protein